MKGILINPFDETIKEVEVTNDYKDIYVLIECSTFDVVRISDEDDMFIDDEGLLKDNRYFRIAGRNYAGRALLLSHNEDGDTMGTTFPMEDLEHLVDFLPKGHRETPYMEFKAWS